MTNILDIFLPYQKKFFTNGRRYKIWLASRQIGKSFTVAGMLVYKALSRKNGLSLCISTGARAAGEIISKAKMFAEAVKTVSRGAIDYTSGFDHVTFGNGSRVLSLPSSTDGANLRGYTACAVVIDEAAYVRNLDEILQAISPTLTRDKDAELILTTTPAGKNGRFFELWRRARDDETWYTQETTVEDAVKDGLDVDIQALRNLCPDEESFEREYLCRFADQDEDFIDQSILQFEDKQFNGWYVAGMDIGRKNDKSAIAILKTNGKINLFEDIILLDKMPYAEQKAFLKKLKTQYNFQKVYIDSGGIGNQFAEDAQLTIDRRYEGLAFTGSNKSKMYEALRARIFDGQLFFSKKIMEIVKSDFGNISKIVTDDGQVKYEAGHSVNGHSDAASAMVLAIQAMHDAKHNEIMPTTLGNWSSAFGYRTSRF